MTGRCRHDAICCGGSVTRVGHLHPDDHAHLQAPTNHHMPDHTDTAPRPFSRLTQLARSTQGIRIAVIIGVGAVLAGMSRTDPAATAAFPPCPTQAILGIDCPACGGLRGTHALLNGELRDALDYNLMLPLLLAVLAAPVLAWLAPLVGRPTRTFNPPGWLIYSVLFVLAVFSVLRNVPVDSLDFLAADLSS